jgi:hypothetical protein
MPDPPAVSPQENEVLAGEPSTKVVPSDGLLIAIVGSKRSMLNGPNPPVEDVLPATSVTACASIERLPSPLVASVNATSLAEARPEVASPAVHTTETSLVYQPPEPRAPDGEPQPTEGAAVSILKGPKGPAVVLFPDLSATVREDVETTPSPAVASVNDPSDPSANPEPSSVELHATDTSDVYHPFDPDTPSGPSQETTGGVLSVPGMTWNVTIVGVSSRNAEPNPAGVVTCVWRGTA